MCLNSIRNSTEGELRLGTRIGFYFDTKSLSHKLLAWRWKGNPAELFSEIDGFVNGLHQETRQRGVLLEKTMERQKLSDILIENAMQGLKSRQYAHSEVMHPLMLLASVAWNREVKESCFMQDQLAGIMSNFDISKETLDAVLVAQDWDAILDRMREYKRARFPDDSRFITLCGYTPWGTLRVEFE